MLLEGGALALLARLSSGRSADGLSVSPCLQTSAFRGGRNHAMPKMAREYSCQSVSPSPLAWITAVEGARAPPGLPGYQATSRLAPKVSRLTGDRDQKARYKAASAFSLKTPLEVARDRRFTEVIFTLRA